MQVGRVVDDGGIEEGRALQGLGASIAAFSNRQRAYMEREKAKRDRATIEDYSVQLERAALEVSSRYKQKKGAEVARDGKFYETWTGEFASKASQLVEQIEDPEVQEMFRRRVGLADVNFQRGLTDYLVRETDAYDQAVYVDGVSVYQQSMGENYLDDSAVMQARDNIVQLTAARAEQMGVPQDSPTFEKMLTDNLQAGHINVISMLLEDGNVEDAQAYFDDAVKSGEIGGDKQDDIRRSIRSVGVDAMTIAYSDRLFNERQPGMSDAEFIKYGAKWIRDNVPDQYLDKTLQRFYARAQEEARVDSLIKVDFSNQAFQIYTEAREGGSMPMAAYKSIPQRVLDGMDQKTRNSIYNMAVREAQQQTIHTDFAAWYELYSMATGSPADRARFRDPAQTNLNDYRDRISSADLKALALLQQDQDKQTIASTAKEIKDRFVRETGLDAEEAYDMLDTAMLELSDMEKRDVTTADLRDIAQRLTIEVQYRRSLNPFSRGVPFGVTTSDLAYEAEIDGIPEADWDVIPDLAATVLRRKRMAGDKTPVTSQDILDLYNELQGVEPGDRVVVPMENTSYYDPSRSLPYAHLRDR